MFSILSTGVAIAAVVASFWSPLWGWGIALAAEAIILVTLFGVKQQRWNHIPELSALGNEMLNKFGHFYTMPFAARDFCNSAAAFNVASIFLGAIDGFKGAWWGVALAVVNLGVMAFTARAFNPTVFITDPRKRMAHDEVIAFVLESQRRMRKQGHQTAAP